MSHVRCCWCFYLLVLMPANVACAAEPCKLAADGKALQQLVVADKATERVRRTAQTLAEYLGKISDAKFAVSTGDGTSGIAVGLPADFPMLPFSKVWDAADPTRSEDYLLRSHQRGVYLVGASELAVEHAVWELLYRLGHRQFFPGETWEVVPRVPALSIAVDVTEHPCYYSRRIWYGNGAADYAKKPYADWCSRNRATSGIALNSGHAYDGILRRNQKECDKHPDYLGLLGGQRKSSKFCISNPGLRKLVADDALAQFAAKPDLQSVSVDPSDGGGWCECEKCKALGSVSDRAVTLANEVAAAVQAKYPDKFIGMYAYNQHSPPPSVRVHPRVIINVATSFLTGGYTVDQLLAGWQKQGATVGIREYYSVHTWDRDLPGAPRGSRPDYLKNTISHFYEKGARFLSAESSDNWAPNGLGYYLAARLMWDVREAKRLDALKADFLDRAFGSAKEPMAKFYQLIDGGNRPLLTDDLMGRMFRLLDEARKQTEDARVHARIDHLILYTHYLELWTAYTGAAGEARQQAFETLMRYAYRIGPTMMIHTTGLSRDLPRRDKSVTLPKEAARNIPAGKNPWKDDKPHGRVEIDELLAAGIANRKLFDFQPVAFSDQLVPAAKLSLPATQAGSMGIYSRGVRDYYTWIEKRTDVLKLKVKSGLVYGNRGPATITLYPTDDVEGKAVDEASVPPDKEEHEITLKTTSAGLHRLEVSDRGIGTALLWPEGVPLTVRSCPESQTTFQGRWSLYFYVPKGTKVVGGYSGGIGTLLDGSGKKVFEFSKQATYFSVPVPRGEDGKLWKFQQCVGKRLLMTVPPYLARSEKELLLPGEVVK